MAEERRLLVTQVTWTDSTGATGKLLFQGTVENQTLDGNVYAGDLRCRVTGQVATDGTVAGTLLSEENESVGSFTAQLDAAKNLLGDLVVDGTVATMWAANAPELPVPSP
jgi:hypothetical protein